MSGATLLVLPTDIADGATQMARDERLLEAACRAGAPEVVARRYLWSPPALSLGRFQAVALDRGGDLPFRVTRRPSGGRAVLHGAGYEWSFAAVFAPGVLPGAHVADAYAVVSTAFAAALETTGVRLDAAREKPYAHSSLCFATSLRHDLLSAAEKVVAVAQVRRRGATLVHGSVLERRPPQRLTAAVERLLGEPWRGGGLAAAGAVPDGEALWAAVVAELAERLGAVIVDGWHPAHEQLAKEAG